MADKNKNGMIIKGVGGRYHVLSDGEVYIIKPRGVYRKKGIKPLVGDMISFDANISLMDKIMPRRNEFLRPSVANVDIMLIVLSIDMPKPDYYLADKLLIYCGINDVKPIIVFNKTDLASESDIRYTKEQYSSTGWSIIEVSAVDGSGLDELKTMCSGGIVVLAGQSGVGKSSLINALYPSQNIEVGEISEKIGRGRHTTRHVELLILEGGAMLVDTPGFTSIALDGLDAEELKYYYPDFEKYRSDCKFADCAHNKEPGCGVKKMVDSGVIPIKRHKRYIEMYEIIQKEGRLY